MKSAVVVVTYNRIRLLKNLIAALREQTIPLNKIIVVNNSSTDGTVEWLDLQNDLLVITQENVGGAGGFYTGLKKAYDLGYDWIWTMDDDCLPKSNAFERIIESKLKIPSVVNSLVLDINDKKTFPFKISGYKKVEEIETVFIKNWLIPYNGTLFHRDVFLKVGFPNKQLVIWGDETEFFYRVANKGKIPVGIVTDSILYHPLNDARFYMSDWDIIKDWRAYFFIRNKLFVYSSKYNYRFLAYLHYFIFATTFLAFIIFLNKTDKKLKIKIFRTAIRHALKKHLSWSINDVRNYVTSIK